MATRRSDGRWVAMARISRGPKGRIPRYGRTEEEAEQKAMAMEMETSPNTQSLPAFQHDSFAAFVYGIWAPHVYKSIRQTTKRSYDSMLTHHILPGLGHLPIATIGYAEVKTMVDGLMRTDRRGPKDANGRTIPQILPDRRKAEVIMRTREILSLYNKLAQARGQQTREDWRLVEPPKRRRKKARKIPATGFTERLLGQAKGTYMEGPLFAALFLGLRRGEVCGLTWGDIDRKELTITISKQIQPEHGCTRVATKGEARIIPVPVELLDFLETKGDKSSDFVFTDHGRPLKPNEVSKQPPRLCRLAGLDPVTFHDLRSFAASNLAALGVDLITIMEILGHTELNTTLIYLNSRDAQKREALSKLFGKLEVDVDKRLETTDRSEKSCCQTQVHLNWWRRGELNPLPSLSAPQLPRASPLYFFSAVISLGVS